MPAQNPYRLATPLAAGPAQKVFAITPSDADELPYVTTGIYVGVTGDVTVKDQLTGDLVKFEAVPAGQILPICVSQVMFFGTTATALVGMA